MHTFEIVLVIAWGWTLAMTILNVFLVPRLKTEEGAAAGPLVSVVIPARDEERSIEQTVRAMLAQTYDDLEVVVVNDRSTDRTGEILAAVAREDSRLTVVTGEEPPAGWLGKPWACHQGSQAARGELLLIVDADIHYTPPAVASIVAEMSRRPDMAMIAALPRFELRGFWEQVTMPMLAFTAYAFVPTWLANRTRIPEIGIGGGTGNMIRRADFDDIGGYAPLHDAVVDDVGMAQHLRRRGKRTMVVLADHLISLHMYDGLGEIVRGFTKNLFAAFGGSFVALVTMFVLMIGFHLLPYGLALRGDRLALVAVGLITLCRLVLFIRLRMRIDNALLAHPLMIAVWTWIFARSAWVTGIRRQLHWRGRNYERAWSRFGSGR